MIFSALPKKKRIFDNFSEPKTPQEIINAMNDLREKQNANAYKIIDDKKVVNKAQQDEIEQDKKYIKSIKEENRQHNKERDFKNVKVEKDFTEYTEKALGEKFEFVEKGIYKITNRIPSRILVKELLKITKDVSEKKKLVSEKQNDIIEKAKQEKGSIEVNLNNKKYIIKLV